MLSTLNIQCDGKICGQGRHVAAGKYLCPHNSLKILYPGLCEEWDYTKNFIGPESYLPGSGALVYWICKISPCECHKWPARIYSRTSGNGCPHCTGIASAYKICPHKNLLYLYPEVCKEWDYTKNFMGPENYPPKSGEYVYWKCRKGSCECHEWYVQICHRTIDGSGCPFCSNQMVCIHSNLLALYPNLYKDWNYQKNMHGPENYPPGSPAKVYWKCGKGHEWIATITDRVSGTACKHCSLKKGYSQKQIRWIDSIINKDNINIQYALSPEGEFKICEIDKVDGFCRETNTVYEFHGDYWHGNPSVFNHNEFNKVNGKTFGELYIKTCERDNKIRQMGYNLVVQWKTENPDEFGLQRLIFFLETASL